MTAHLSGFAQLGPRFWDYRSCIRTPHYLKRRHERGFDERRLAELWEHGEWSADDRGFLVRRHFRGEGTWELAVGVDDDFRTPHLLTIRFSQRRAA